MSGKDIGKELCARLEQGAKIAALAREYGVSRQTVYSWARISSEGDAGPINAGRGRTPAKRS